MGQSAYCSERQFLRLAPWLQKAESRKKTRPGLRVVQPAISQQIKTLEQELEVQLLVRTKRSVKLTAAGNAFLREANDILNRVDHSKVEARRAAQGETGRLSIGFNAGSSLFLPELIRAYRTQYPAVPIHLYDQTPKEQLDALELGRIDMGFTRPLPKTQAGRFVEQLVYRDCVMTVLPDRHALAGLRKIRLEKLANEDWVFLNRSSVPELVGEFTLLCTKAGFSPRVITEAARMQTVLTMVPPELASSWRLVAFATFTNPASRLFQFSPTRLHLTLSPSVLRVNRRRRLQLFSTCFGNSFL